MSKKRSLSKKVSTELSLPVGYYELLNDLKARIQGAQLKAALSVNQELIRLYWEIGKEIVDRQKSGGWGSKTIDRSRPATARRRSSAT